MNILITGGTGFVGSLLTNRLAGDGHSIVIVTRKAPVSASRGNPVRYVEGNPAEAGAWQEQLKDQDAVVNLAGETVFGRWTATKKEKIRASRIETTSRIVEALAGDRETVLVNGSAVGYYGARGDAVVTESDPPGDGFLANLSKDWEAEALKAREKGIRVAVTRIGVVLGREGGAMKRMTTPFRLFAGGPIGSGRQWLPWVHLDDLVEAFRFLIRRADLDGPFNITAPEPVRNTAFASILGRVLGRPSWLPVPGFALKIGLGEFSSVLLTGQRVLPQRLLEAGFSFRHEKLEEAFRDLLEIESVRG